MTRFVSDRLTALILVLMLGLTGYGAEQIGNRYQGSAPAMEGNVYVLTCYISETGWGETELKDFSALIQEAEDWLVKQAQGYGKQVSFVNGTAGVETPLIVSNIVSGNGIGDEPVDLVSRLMPMIGYKNGLEFVDWVKENTGCDGSLVLIAANKPGRGYSMAYQDLYDKEAYYLEGTILYTSYRDGAPLCAAAIAHEMCHLFGAEDLYATFLQTKENEARARELFPDDIMLRVSYNIDDLSIGSLSAWFMGLTDEMEDWYLDFLYQGQ